LLQAIVDLVPTGSMETFSGNEDALLLKIGFCGAKSSTAVSTISYKTIGWSVVKY
jgi:hypothetical protein